MVNVPLLLYMVTDHCNLRCENCCTLSPFSDIKYSELESLKRDLELLEGKISVDKFSLMGGEPTLHPNLLDIILAVKKSNIARIIELSTNGLTLPDINPEIINQVDVVTVPIYPSVKLRTVKNKKIKYHNVVSFYNFLRDEPVSSEIAQGVYERCKSAHEWKCLMLRDGFIYKCSVTPKLNLKVSNYINDSDRVMVEGDLEGFINRKEHLEGCKWCYGTDNPVVLHKQIKFIKK